VRVRSQHHSCRHAEGQSKRTAVVLRQQDSKLPSASEKRHAVTDHTHPSTQAYGFLSVAQDLEALYVGPAFELEGRYAQVLTTLFVTLLFAGAIPLLLPLAALALALSFWVDKLAFFRYSNSLQAYIHTRIYTVWPIHTKLSKAAQPAWSLTRSLDV
jgi:hypothetical protein